MKPVPQREIGLSLFEPFTDQVSGVRFFILREPVAPVQQGFYFTNSSFSADHRYLWFYCAFPPAPSHCLGVADLVRGTVDCYPATAFHAASPMVDDTTGGVFWTCGAGVWRRGPMPDDGVELVNRLPDELVAGRHIARLATHLTRSADGRGLLLDARIGCESVIGLLPSAGADFELWGRYERHYDHGQMSPSDPDVALLAEDHVTDPVTGITTRYTDRLWLQRRGQPIRPVFPTPTICTHEWWDAGGEFVYAVSYGRKDTRGLPSGTLKIHTQTAAVTLAWPAWNWHAHDWDRGRWFVGDRRGKEFYRGCPSSVWFMNNDTGREIAIVSHNPEHFTIGQQYHIDPHPRFSPDGSWIVFTTTVRGRVDLAIARTADLVERTS